MHKKCIKIHFMYLKIVGMGDVNRHGPSKSLKSLSIKKENNLKLTCTCYLPSMC